MGKMLRNHLEKGQDNELKMVFYSEIPRVQFCSRWLNEECGRRISSRAECRGVTMKAGASSHWGLSLPSQAAGAFFDPDLPAQLTWFMRSLLCASA